MKNECIYIVIPRMVLPEHCGFTCCSNSSVDHIQMKEQARQQRAKEASEWQKKNTAAAPAPLFDPPIQVSNIP